MFLKLSNSARKSIKKIWAQTFWPEAYLAQTFSSVPGDLRVFRAFASLFSQYNVPRDSPVLHQSL